MNTSCAPHSGRRVWGQISKKSTFSTKSKKSWKASLCQYRKVGCQKIEEIDANQEICVLLPEGRGSEIEEIDAFDEIEEIVESASLPVPEGRVSKNRRNRRKRRNMCAGAGG